MGKNECAIGIDGEVCSTDDAIGEVHKFIVERGGSNNPKSAVNTINVARKMTKCNTEQCVLETVSVANPESRAIIKETINGRIKPKGPAHSNALLTNNDIDTIIEQLRRQYKLKHIYFHMSNFDEDSRGHILNNTNLLTDVVEKGEKYMCVVLNTDKYGRGGIHWFCLFCDFSGSGKTGTPFHIEYFNSSGNPPISSVSKWMWENQSNIQNAGYTVVVHDSMPIQHQIDTNTECGVYCLYYISQRLIGESRSTFDSRVTDASMLQFRSELFKDDNEVPIIMLGGGNRSFKKAARGGRGRNSSRGGGKWQHQKKIPALSSPAAVKRINEQYRAANKKLTLLDPTGGSGHYDDADMKDGKYAYVSLMFKKPGYLPGMLTMIKSLQDNGTTHDIVVMLTDDLPDEVGAILRRAGAIVVTVPYIEKKELDINRHIMTRYGDWAHVAFTKFNMLNLTQYDKVLFIEPDEHDDENIDELFQRPTPAGLFHNINGYPQKSKSGAYVVNSPYIGIPDGGYIPPSAYQEAKDNWGHDAIGSRILIKPDAKIFEMFKTKLKALKKFGHSRVIGTMVDEMAFTWLYMEVLKWPMYNIHIRYSFVPWKDQDPADEEFKKGIAVNHFFGLENPWVMAPNSYKDEYWLKWWRTFKSLDLSVADSKYISQFMGTGVRDLSKKTHPNKKTKNGGLVVRRKSGNSKSPMVVSTCHKEYIIGSDNMEKDNLKYESKYVFRVSKNDTIIQDNLKKGYLYGIKILILLNSYVRPDDVILDVGANIGVISIPVSKMAHRGTVHAFEPFKQNADHLEWNVMKNGSKNIQVHRLAVGHENGDTTLSDQLVGKDAKYVSEKTMDKTKMINYGHVRLGTDGQKVKMTTIDSMGLKRVDVIKVDVEGAEPLVFYGAQNTIRKYMPIIVFERNEHGVSKSMIESMGLDSSIYNFDIVKYATSLGYTTMINIPSDDYVLIPPRRGPTFTDPLLNLVPVKKFRGIKNVGEMELKYFAKLDWSLL
jgi:FkbM family methyltransferase